MKLAVVGSVKFTHPDAMHTARQIIMHKLAVFAPELVISGGASGVDSLAVSCAQLARIPWVEYLPENARWAPLGFMDRNQKIAEECTHLLALRDHHSANNGWGEGAKRGTYGSGWTADMAEQLGRPVERIVL